MKFKKEFFTCLLLSAFSEILLAGEWSGQVGIESRIFTESPAYDGQHGNNSSLIIHPEYYQEFDSGKESITFSPYVRIDQNDNERSHADIRELTWIKVLDDLEWRVGIRKVFWGVTESQHLVDIINQTDAVDSPDGEDKLGQPMVNLSYNTSYGTIDAFVLPYFRERTFAGKQGRLRSNPYVDTSTVLYESKDKEKHIDYAFRWTHNIDEWDIGLSYFNGTSRDPRFVTGTDSSGDTVVNPYYDIVDQFGIDIQATYNNWLWKIEGIRRSGIGGTSVSRYNALTAGLEYTFYSLIGESTDLGIVAEYLYDNRGASASTPFEDDILLALRFALNDEQSSEALFGIINDVDTSAAIYSIEASRRLSEHVKLSIEARQYKDLSSNDVLFSYLKDDYIQFELAYFF